MHLNTFNKTSTSPHILNYFELFANPKIFKKKLLKLKKKKNRQSRQKSRNVSHILRMFHKGLKVKQRVSHLK